MAAGEPTLGQKHFNSFLMKPKTIFFFGLLISLCASAVGFVNWHQSDSTKVGINSKPPVLFTHDLLSSLDPVAKLDLVYEVEPRFFTRITREQLLAANSVYDLLPERSTAGVQSYHQVGVKVIKGKEEVEVRGEGGALTSEQKDLLTSADYGSDLHLTGITWLGRIGLDPVRKERLTHYLTVVPHQQAEYEGGYGALTTYLRTHTLEATAIIREDQLEPGRVLFTITPEGKLEGVQLDATCGYPEIDALLVESIQQMPGSWEPATDASGKKVSQELTFFFGSMGC
jgi:hypothetical protein